MKDIKMSDVFDLPISHDYRNLYNKNGKMIVNACDVQEGDAKAIVLAVNNYDKLVEALKAIAKTVSCSGHASSIATEALGEIKE